MYVGGPKARVGPGVGAITAGKALAELRSQDGGSPGSGGLGDVRQEGDRGSGERGQWTWASPGFGRADVELDGLGLSLWKRVLTLKRGFVKPGWTLAGLGFSTDQSLLLRAV